MKILVLISALLSLAKTQCEFSNTELEGTNLNQGNLLRTENSDNCEQVCNLTMDCEGFTYYKNESKLKYVYKM